MWGVMRYLSSVLKRGELGLLRRPRFGSLPELKLQYLPCTCCWRSRVPLASFNTLNSTLTASTSSSEPCKKDGSRPLDDFYTLEERNTILKVLNTASMSELTSVKVLRKRKSLSIVEYRSKNGPFKTLESVINVPLLKHKSAVEVFDSIVNTDRKSVINVPLLKHKSAVEVFDSIVNTDRKKMMANVQKFILPEVDSSWLQGANSIVSIVVGVKKIAWAHVDHKMTVLDWQEQNCRNFLSQTYTASAYLNEVSSVVSCLPSADFYLIEKSSMSMHVESLFPIIVHLRVVEAMLFALLEPRVSPTKTNIPPRVLNIVRNAVGRHFGLMVGKTRISGAQTVKGLMTESTMQTLPRINIPQKLLVKYRDHFDMSVKGTGDELIDVLLQAVAFYELFTQPSQSAGLLSCTDFSVAETPEL